MSHSLRSVCVGSIYRPTGRVNIRQPFHCFTGEHNNSSPVKRRRRRGWRLIVRQFLDSRITSGRDADSHVAVRLPLMIVRLLAVLAAVRINTVHIIYV